MLQKQSRHRHRRLRGCRVAGSQSSVGSPATFIHFSSKKYALSVDNFPERLRDSRDVALIKTAGKTVHPRCIKGLGFPKDMTGSEPQNRRLGYAASVPMG